MPKSPDAFRTISEVADWLGVQAHVLRFWESKFTQVKPVKRAGGRRYYRPADMLLLGGIKKLLHEDGLTIKGAQKILRENGVEHVADMSQPLDDLTLAVIVGNVQDAALATADETDIIADNSVEDMLGTSDPETPDAQEHIAEGAGGDPALSRDDHPEEPAAAPEVTEDAPQAPSLLSGDIAETPPSESGGKAEPPAEASAPPQPTAPPDPQQVPAPDATPPLAGGPQADDAAASAPEIASEPTPAPGPEPTPDPAPEAGPDVNPDQQEDTAAPQMQFRRWDDVVPAAAGPDAPPPETEAAVDTPPDEDTSPQQREPEPSGASLDDALPDDPENNGATEPQAILPEADISLSTEAQGPETSPEENPPAPQEGTGAEPPAEAEATSPLPAAKKPRVADVPPVPAAHELEVEPSLLSALAGVRNLSEAQAREIQPWLARLTRLRDSMSGTIDKHHKD